MDRIDVNKTFETPSILSVASEEEEARSMPKRGLLFGGGISTVEVDSSFFPYVEWEEPPASAALSQATDSFLSPLRGGLADQVAREKFFGNGALSTSGQESPYQSSQISRKRGVEASPMERAVQVLHSATIGISPEDKEKGALQMAYKAMIKATPATKKRCITRLQGGFKELIAKDGNQVIHSDPGPLVAGIHGMQPHLKSTAFRFMGQVQSAVQKEHPRLVTMFNLDHITKPTVYQGKGMGFHFCPLGGESTDVIIRDQIVNPNTGVWRAEWEYETVRKTSTFFPQTIRSIEYLLWLFSEAKEVLTNENSKCSLYKIPTGRNPQYPEWEELQEAFFMEVYHRNASTVVWSAFPVFHYVQYDPLAHFQITPELLISAADILAMAQSEACKVSYRNESCAVVDIAPCDKRFPVSQGILIHFDQIYKDLILPLPSIK